VKAPCEDVRGYLNVCFGDNAGHLGVDGEAAPGNDHPAGDHFLLEQGGRFSGMLAAHVDFKEAANQGRCQLRVQAGKMEQPGQAFGQAARRPGDLQDANNHRKEDDKTADQEESLHGFPDGRRP